jgi:EAL domain-containing protein (putative c-di-GMP-specific phosphodiesterase class I)
MECFFTFEYTDEIFFEITEIAGFANLADATASIEKLSLKECQYALDDFGTGLSFAYLNNLSVDYLKIDGVFVKSIVNDPIDYAIVKSVDENG